VAAIQYACGGGNINFCGSPLAGALALDHAVQLVATGKAERAIALGVDSVPEGLERAPLEGACAVVLEPEGDATRAIEESSVRGANGGEHDGIAVTPDMAAWAPMASTFGVVLAAAMAEGCKGAVSMSDGATRVSVGLGD
jgi:hypothetical protein